MDCCDILIAGGGPAGSSCAWGLRNSGLEVAILDKQRFPRDKVCGGWITPQVLKALRIDPVAYGAERTLQPITSFRTGSIGGAAPIHTDYGKPVSYGIRRCEFDEYLLRRCGARVLEGVGLASIERDGGSWIVNGNLRARLVVGAGGHFCPVARHFGAKATAAAVVAQETEFEMDERQQAHCPVRAITPELYFCPDMKGYGWCFRKGNFLNIGLGRADSHGLPEQVNGFVRFLATLGMSAELPAMRGHAYFLYGTSQAEIATSNRRFITVKSPRTCQTVLERNFVGIVFGEIVPNRATYRANHAIRAISEIAKSITCVFSMLTESSTPPASTNYLI